MKLIYTNNWLAKLILLGKYNTIMLFGFILSKLESLTADDERHERTHQVQFLECMAIATIPALVLTILASPWWLLLIPLFYYIWYIVEYLIIRIRGLKTGVGQNEAYHDVSFEEEAHNNDTNAEYLQNRKLFAWWSYIRIGSYQKEDTSSTTEEGGEA